MDNLELCYKNQLKKINFLERKVSISKENTILYGAPKSGKTFLIIDYLSTLPNGSYIYIDLKDFRNYKLDLNNNLNKFIKNSSIETVAIDNYTKNINLPKTKYTIISCEEKININNFKIIEVNPLDFEEYLLFDKRHHSITQLFNFYLKYGNLPEISSINEYLRVKRNQDIIKLITNDDIEIVIFSFLAEKIGNILSIYQIFSELKKVIKISKNRVYELINRYKNSNRIFFLDKFNQNSSSKKLYLYNYAFKDVISYEKNLQKIFENMIFLELRGRFENIFYTDSIEFYIPNKNLIIIPLAFVLENSLINKIKILKNDLKRLKITNIQFITFGFEYNKTIDKIDIEAISFWQWALIK